MKHQTAVSLTLALLTLLSLIGCSPAAATKPAAPQTPLSTTSATQEADVPPSATGTTRTTFQSTPVTSAATELPTTTAAPPPSTAPPSSTAAPAPSTTPAPETTQITSSVPPLPTATPTVAPTTTKPPTTTTRPPTNTTTAAAPPTFPAISVPPVPSAQTPTAQEQAALNSVTAQLKNSFAYFLACLTESRPKNPGMEALYDAKITVLQDQELDSKIANNKLWLVDTAAAAGGRTIAFVAVYPDPAMRAEAWYALQVAKLSMPLLEEFMATPFPSTVITVHYGFMMGSSGGGGGLILEDKATYMGRWKAPMMYYDPVICHELSHAYIGHEGLNQFLEIYVYNRLLGRTSSLADWVYVRDYKTITGAKTGYAAILDVYKAIGLEATQRAYRMVYQLKPPYGQVLPENCRQAFVDQAPEALKTAVRNMMVNVTY